MYKSKSEYYELPTKYGETVVRLLVQSPTRMYAYWEVNDNSTQNFRFDYNVCTPVLKITNLTMNYSYEVNIDPYANNYYIDVKDVNCDYKVELGRRYNNEYMAVYESNEVTMPKNTPVRQNESEEIVYRNCIKIDQTEKFRIYYNKNRFNENNKQDYYGLTFDADDSISSGNIYNE